LNGRVKLPTIVKVERLTLMTIPGEFGSPVPKYANPLTVSMAAALGKFWPGFSVSDATRVCARTGAADWRRVRSTTRTHREIRVVCGLETV
jgi:hypothetical protein